ncbi:hypothetical protein M231_04143 [Tremella mesenterica]|uniref:Uncharacterized protein n=1 Tax=Tremella mesenterica TaxID=5217 RepID=A0A4V1M400_TREME|nr:uncharacterized protein TREMEDRAFT_62292 [Tremella mesenterica DSM 1558]EIW69426.1 hypothetical protein TREMEDRAFT_62292 [Tremella mesenterica DSM 1558]RXK38637.1 hypothetical protein M231_04143 [Tremella mesenterica]
MHFHPVIFLLASGTMMISGRVVPHKSSEVDSELNPRATILNGPTCQGGSLNAHDCNVALLGLGGGIAGPIEFLRVDATTNSSTSGGCTMTVTTTNGGTAIDISKGRLEQGQKAAISTCGQQAWTVTVQGGAVNGDLIIQQSASA